jgi:hypothetical protein
MGQHHAQFEKFNTSPFVLLFHAMQRGYTRVSQIERDILPAKTFSSMETSAGRMVEAVALPVYGWENVESEMHTSDSALDGKKLDDGKLQLATLKSGPRCLNDEMSENFADAIINHASAWAGTHEVDKMEFTYGVLYGTKKRSNKKDWHILRNLKEKLPADSMTRSPDDRWDCAFARDGLSVDVAIRIGVDWWTYLGGPTCFVELCSAVIRACVQPGDEDTPSQEFTIADIPAMISTANVPDDYNVAILQHSQLQWFFFIAGHFCDELAEG